MTTSSAPTKQTILLLTMLAYSSAFMAPGAITTTTRTSTATSTTNTQLSAWTLPAPVQRMTASTSYWYQDCGSAVQRQIVYDDDHEDSLLQQFWWDNENDERGVAFARLSFLQDDDDTTALAETQEEDDGSGFSPVRMVRGLWQRIRGSGEEEGQ